MASKQVTMDADTAANMDTNGDGHISAEEAAMDLEFKRKRLEDNDAMRDAQRNMAWFALFGMLLYPFATLGGMAPTYFVSVAAIVAAFYGKSAIENKNNS
jgi:hypothetical protein